MQALLGGLELLVVGGFVLAKSAGILEAMTDPEAFACRMSLDSAAL